MTDARPSCADCGLPVTDGIPDCQTLFELVLAEHFEKPAAHAGTHRLFVDAFCMQHPDQGCISFKSFAAHAMHLCWSVERGGDCALPNERLRRWGERHPHWDKPPLPVSRGRLTIADVAYAPAAEHGDAVHRWATDVWSAYAYLHPTIRHWVDLALRDDRPRRT